MAQNKTHKTVKLPTKVKILNKTFTITYTDNENDVDHYGEIKCNGQIHFNRQSIRVLRANRPYESIIGTVWHEILHALGWALRYNDLVDNEGMVAVLSSAIQCVIQDNPEIALLTMERRKIK